MGKKVSKVFGVIFVVIGILGFFNDPILGLFDVDTVHNIVHIVLGLALLLAPGARATLAVGAVYLVVALLGFFGGSGVVLGFLRVNGADNWLHLALAIVLIAASRCSSWKGSAPMSAPSSGAPMA